MGGAYYNGFGECFEIFDQTTSEFTGDSFYDFDIAESWVLANGGYDRYTIYFKI